MPSRSGSTGPTMRTASPGPGNGWRATISSGTPSTRPRSRNLVLEQLAQRLEQLEAHALGEAATLWWLLMVAEGPRTDTELDDVRVERPLGEEGGVGICLASSSNTSMKVTR